VEVDPTRMCELLVGLGDVEVVGVDDEVGLPLRVHIRCQAARPDCGAWWPGDLSPESAAATAPTCVAAGRRWLSHPQVHSGQPDDRWMVTRLRGLLEVSIAPTQTRHGSTRSSTLTVG